MADGCPFPKAWCNRRLDKGEHLYHQGDPVEGIHVLLSGLVAMERVDEDGQFAILRIVEPGALLPHSGLLGRELHNGSARALTPVQACLVSTATVKAAIADDPLLGLNLLQRGCEELRRSEDAIFRLCCGDLSERVMGVLEMLAGQLGEGQSDGDVALTLPISWREVGAMVGSRSEVISRLLRRLSADRRLSFRGHRVVLHRARPAMRACG
ncbi:MAG: Crp/Fnr family transcriptional regulator [Actinomycetota bacterium]